MTLDTQTRRQSILRVNLPHIACIHMIVYTRDTLIEQRSRAIPDIKMLVNKLLFTESV